MNLPRFVALFQTVAGLSFPVIVAFTAAIGAAIGSFLNVVIHRVPREESIVFPNSRCPACGTAIRPYDNVPILSYLALRGRCRSCHSRISPRYPAVETLTAIVYVAVALCRGLTPALPFELIFATSIIALVFIDAEHMLLPNVITYPGIVFAIIARAAIPYLAGPRLLDDIGMLANLLPHTWPLWAISLTGAAIGALAGGGSLWLIGWFWERFRGVEAMGLGDVKMMFMVGAFLGWRLAVLTIFIGVLSGSITGVAIVLKSKQRDLQTLLPFGIFLGIGAMTSLLVGTQIITWYVSQYGL